jgi:hypothetical protein
MTVTATRRYFMVVAYVKTAGGYWKMRLGYGKTMPGIWLVEEAALNQAFKATRGSP